MHATSSIRHLTPVVPPAQTGTTQPPSTPKNTVPVPRQMIPLPYQEGQTILGRDKRGGGESPLAYVNLGPSSETSSSASTQPNKRSRLVQQDDMDIEALGYQPDESPSNVPQSINTSPSNSGSPPRVTFAQMAKGKVKATTFAEITSQPKSSTTLINRTI